MSVEEENAPVEAPAVSTESHRQELKREITDFVKLVIWFLIIFLGMKTYVMEAYEVQGESMEPTLESNDRILVLKLPHIISQFSLFSGLTPIDPGDIIVFDSPDNPSKKRYVKRVIARGPNQRRRATVDAGSQGEESSEPAGVRVEYSRGEVYVDNRIIDESYLTERARISPDRHELVLGSGEYYVLGDNRRVSKDSRSFDAVEKESIIGKAVLRFWPPKKISFIW